MIPYRRFGLTLALTHDCNMRCTYCYAGRKRPGVIAERVGRKAIDRALASVEPGGVLEIGFFGGEPALEAALALRLVEHARSRAAERGARLSLSMTTNGTITSASAWALMIRPDMELAVSVDGAPGTHDRHRRFAAGGGGGTSARVTETVRRLVEAGRRVRAVMVVRPDTLRGLASNIRYLRGLGLEGVDPALDLWAAWTRADVRALGAAVEGAASAWLEGLPGFSVGWFDAKAAHLSGLVEGCGECNPRCRFGAGELAVAPSGRLYPCERLIGEDAGEDVPAVTGALPGHALEGDDFLDVPAPAAARAPASPECAACTARAFCDTTCRCSNLVRTGDAARPDGLLCALNRACLREVAKVIRPPLHKCASAS
ncbi:MAG: radical SAM protein [Planctomycetota bacterium]|jgi:uncharacterized protein